MSTDGIVPKQEPLENGAPAPTTDAAQIAAALPGLQESVFGALVREPSTASA